MDTEFHGYSVHRSSPPRETPRWSLRVHVVVELSSILQGATRTTRGDSRQPFLMALVRFNNNLVWLEREHEGTWRYFGLAVVPRGLQENPPRTTHPPSTLCTSGTSSTQSNLVLSSRVRYCWRAPCWVPPPNLPNPSCSSKLPSTLQVLGLLVSTCLAMQIFSQATSELPRFYVVWPFYGVVLVKKKSWGPGRQTRGQRGLASSYLTLSTSTRTIATYSTYLVSSCCMALHWPGLALAWYWPCTTPLQRSHALLR